ncbi:MAG: hypothetical protein AAB772_01060 [Patescibacteria group bacterium]
MFNVKCDMGKVLNVECDRKKYYIQHFTFHLSLVKGILRLFSFLTQESGAVLSVEAGANFFWRGSDPAPWLFA